MWDRAKAEDSKRVNAITTEKQRIEVAQMVDDDDDDYDY